MVTREQVEDYLRTVEDDEFREVAKLIFDRMNIPRPWRYYQEEECDCGTVTVPADHE